MLGAGFLLSAAGSASAATTVGQLFAPTTGTGSDLTILQTFASGNSYTVPSAGVITSWKFQDGSPTVTTLKLKVGRSAPGGMYMIVGESPAGTQTANAVSGPFPANIPVHAGDLIGVYATSPQPYYATVDAGDTEVYRIGDEPLGSPNAYSPFTGGRIPVQAVVTGPPASSLTPPAFSTCSGAGTVTADTGTTPKAVHFKLNGGGEQVAATDSTGAVSVAVPPGTSSVEYWGEDRLGQLEMPHHTISVLVDNTPPTVVITSDQNKTVYNAGDKASVTTKASDPDSGLMTDPSTAGQSIATAHAGSFSVSKSATDRCGNAGRATFNYTVRPVDSRLVVAPDAFFSAPRGPAIIARVPGARVAYTASDAGTTSFTVFRAVRGVKRGSACHKPRPGRGGKRCARLVKLGGFRRTDTVGANQFRFTGRVAGKSLRPGRYQLVAVPTASGLTGPAVRRNFRIRV